MDSFSRKKDAAGIAVVAALMIIAAAPAFAGPRYSDPSVTIVRNADGSGRVTGTLGGVRNSPGLIERLSCTLTRSENVLTGGAVQRTTVASCSARDKIGATATCLSTSDAFGNALSGLSNDGLIDFTYNSSGLCTEIVVYESSSLERKR
jgi:hypothetical protein